MSHGTWKRNYTKYILSALMCGSMIWSAGLAADASEITAKDQEILVSVAATDESGVVVETEPESVTVQLVELDQGDYQIVSALDGTVLSTSGRGGGEGAAIVCREDRSLTVQTYRIKQAKNGSLTLCSRTAKGKVLRSTAEGLVQASQSAVEEEKFVAVEEEDGRLSLRLASDPTQALTNQGDVAVMTAYCGDDAQKWTLRVDEQLHEKTIESGIYTIDNVKRGTSMMVSGASNATNQPLCMKDKMISKAQKFYVNYVGEGKYTIMAFAGDGKSVRVASALGSRLKLGKSIRYYIDEKWDGTYAILRAGSSYTAVRAGTSQVKTSNYSGSTAESWTFDSKVTEDESAVSKRLKSIMKKYPSGTYLGSGYTFAGGYQCMGFGREVFCRTFGPETRWNYDGSAKSSVYSKNYEVVARSSSYSASSIKKLIAKASPGDVLQMNTPKIHTMIFVSCDDEGFTVYDANWVGANQVSVRHVSYSAWSGRNSSGISVLHSTYYPAK